MANCLKHQKPAAVPPFADDPRWARVVARDHTADGLFWFSVVTTGVYCRPSCPSRTANPGNVKFHDTLEAAKATGFRACKRCNPDGLSVEAENVAIVAKVCRLIEQSVEEPSLTDLANAVELSPSYFHRLFKGVTGVTPKKIMPPPIERRVSVRDWRNAIRSQRRYTMPASIQAADFTKKLLTCSA